MRSGTFIGLAVGLVTGACLVKFSPRAQKMVDEAKDMVKQKVNNEHEMMMNDMQNGIQTETQNF